VSGNYVTSKSLNKQLIIRLGLIVSLLAIVVLISCEVIMHFLYFQNDRAAVKAEASKISILIDAEQKAIAASVRDYAVWTDTYEYALDPNIPKYEKDNYTIPTLSVMGVDFVVMMQGPHRVLFSSQNYKEKIEGNPIIPVIDPVILSELSKLPIWEAGLPEEPEPTSYIVFVHGRPLLLGVSGVFNSEGDEQASNTVLVFARYMDDAFLTHLKQMSTADIEFLPAKPDIAKSMALFYHDVSYVTAKPSLHPDTMWVKVRQVIDWEPRGLLIVSFTVGLILVLCIAGWALSYTIKTLVLNRIELFAELAWQRMFGKKTYWPIDSGNELDLLARSFNELMDELQLAQNNLHVLSVTDALTTLGNRRGLEQEIELTVQACQPHADLSMLLMDLDGFKLINDSLGHAAGDLLLQEVSQRMRQVMRRQDRIFRMGGDEFAVLMPNTNNEQGCRMAERLLEQLVAPIHFGKHLLNISGSIGIAQWNHGITGMELMRHADLAMYEAKRRGKSCIAVYEEGMSGVASERMLMEQALRHAIAENQIEPHFQPVVDTETQEIIALEMLARWSNNGEQIPPTEFIRLAEDMGLINPLFEQLLQKGLDALQHFRAEMPELKLQVNVSPMQFADRTLAETLLRTMQNHHLPPQALVVELTESATLLYPEQVEQTMRQLVDAGVGLHLDDFGTGYSSLARLRDLPFDTVKLDRSFVVMMASGDTALSQAVFDMASSMKMNLIAEGVENANELMRLQEIGYRRMQGFMFAHPMPEQEMTAWLHEHRGSSVI